MTWATAADGDDDAALIHCVYIKLYSLQATAAIYADTQTIKRGKEIIDTK